jgi:MATE family multidrug resistance protein
MKLLMIFSYFTDGFAYAGEALVGRYVGAGNRQMYKESVKWTFIWSMSIALIFIVIYHFAGVPMLQLMTSDASVVDASREYLPWLLLMPVVGCAAFTWDGIYVGATASRPMRNSMLWAVVAFVAVWAAGILLLNHCPSWFSLDVADDSASLFNRLAMHVLMAAYFAHLLARTVYLTVRSKCCYPKC